MTRELSHAPRTFSAATWNVFHGTPVRELEPILDQLVEHVGLFMFQECSQEGFTDMLEAAGLEYSHQGQWCVAWWPEWHHVASGHRVLSDVRYFTTEGHPMRSEAQWAILADDAGRTVTALSYHLPSHVQVATPPARRMEALKGSMATLEQLGAQAKTTAVVFAGDDNVDETHQPRLWDFMRFRATGLRLVMAPTPTHAGGRRIDDFRVRGAVHVGKGSTRAGGGDHRVHVRGFHWPS